eukprot:GHVN01035750.1.p1 GENE.GHVN01035750.1~~GHVN01035750.1.p1  ORF type:complete len:229 (+),score=25.20 GHVN01035750.1:47-733(+)
MCEFRQESFVSINSHLESAPEDGDLSCENPAHLLTDPSSASSTKRQHHRSNTDTASEYVRGKNRSKYWWKKHQATSSEHAASTSPKKEGGTSATTVANGIEVHYLQSVASNSSRRFLMPTSAPPTVEIDDGRPTSSQSKHTMHKLHASAIKFQKRSVTAIRLQAQSARRRFKGSGSAHQYPNTRPVASGRQNSDCPSSQRAVPSPDIDSWLYQNKQEIMERINGVPVR